MNQLSEAVARYHKILESDQYKDLSWAHELQERMKAHNLVVSGRPVSPVLRPHFITRRQYAGLVKAVESFSSAIERIEKHGHRQSGVAVAHGIAAGREDAGRGGSRLFVPGGHFAASIRI